MVNQSQNIFPILRAKMAEKNDDVIDLSIALKVSSDSVRRLLSGDNEFELAELKILSIRYNTGIDNLFIEKPTKSI